MFWSSFISEGVLSMFPVSSCSSLCSLFTSQIKSPVDIDPSFSYMKLIFKIYLAASIYIRCNAVYWIGLHPTRMEAIEGETTTQNIDILATNDLREDAIAPDKRIRFRPGKNGHTSIIRFKAPADVDPGKNSRRHEL